jgi:exo-beta-1,3-glucanase (GH17 family)
MLRARPSLLYSLLLAIALLSIQYWWQRATPQILVDALSDHLSCVSYAPFYRSFENPFDKTTYIDAARIDSDLQKLSERFDCVRTYSVSQGLHVVPELAKKHGMKTLMGIWIGRSTLENERELTKGIDTAKKNRSSLRGIVVGNEVLLRGEQPAQKLKELIARVRHSVGEVPVTYADVWEFWLKNADLKDGVDFATIHILPYWEDRPIPVEYAVGHVSHIFHHVQDQLKGKPVMIGETGWPSYGRQRLGAVPGLVEEARFIREFQVRAQLENIPYNVIEAFDQGWKRKLEGAVGGYWGIFDRLGNPKFPFKGPVAEAPAWAWTALGITGVLLTLFIVSWSPLRSRSEALLFLAISGIGGAFMAAFWRDLWMANRSALEWAVTLPYAFIQILVILGVGGLLAGWCSRNRPPPVIAPMSAVIRWARRNEKVYDPIGLSLGCLRFLILLGAGFVTTLLVFDPRYRDFPCALYGFPALGFALLSWIQIRIRSAIEENVLALWIAIGGIWSVVSEHLLTPPDAAWSFAESLNPAALLWLLISLTLAGSILVPLFTKNRTRQYEYS